MLFCLLSSQMTWATLAHVANDWLAVPLAIWTLVFMIRAASSPTLANLAVASLVLSAGLLTKSYFLALVPVLFGIVGYPGQLAWRWQHTRRWLRSAPDPGTSAITASTTC